MIILPETDSEATFIKRQFSIHDNNPTAEIKLGIDFPQLVNDWFSMRFKEYNCRLKFLYTEADI